MKNTKYFDKKTSILNKIREDNQKIALISLNPINRYMLIVGNYFSAFQGYINGNITIMSKATRENQTFQIYIDATTSYASWDSDHHVVILPPGEYIIFWQLTPFTSIMRIYSHGRFMTDDPQEVNQLQNLIIMVSGFVGAFIAIAVILSYVRKRKHNSY